jgi:hypothetical protein
MILPATVVAHEVVEPAVGELRVEQKREVRRDELRADLFRRAIVCRFDGDHQRPRHVVGAVAERPVRHVEARVLEHTDVVGHRDQMIEDRPACVGHRR